MSLRKVTVAAILAFASFASAGLQPEPQSPVRGSDTVKGCYGSFGDLALQSEITKDDFNSRGKCNALCRSKNKNVAATNEDSCYCGDEYPPKSTLVEDDKCSEPCPGIDQEACGGLNTYSVYNTGVRVTVADQEDPQSSAGPSSTSSGGSSSSSGNDLYPSLSPRCDQVHVNLISNSPHRWC